MELTEQRSKNPPGRHEKQESVRVLMGKKRKVCVQESESENKTAWCASKKRAQAHLAFDCRNSPPYPTIHMRHATGCHNTA